VGNLTFQHKQYQQSYYRNSTKTSFAKETACSPHETRKKSPSGDLGVNRLAHSRIIHYLRWEGNNSQYNGKELNQDFGLHWMGF
jgi:hypothetical protein